MYKCNYLQASNLAGFTCRYFQVQDLNLQAFVRLVVKDPLTVICVSVFNTLACINFSERRQNNCFFNRS